MVHHVACYFSRSSREPDELGYGLSYAWSWSPFSKSHGADRRRPRLLRRKVPHTQTSTSQAFPPPWWGSLVFLEDITVHRVAVVHSMLYWSWMCSKGCFRALRRLVCPCAHKHASTGVQFCFSVLQTDQKLNKHCFTQRGRINGYHGLSLTMSHNLIKLTPSFWGKKNERPLFRVMKWRYHRVAFLPGVSGETLLLSSFRWWAELGSVLVVQLTPPFPCWLSVGCPPLPWRLLPLSSCFPCDPPAKVGRVSSWLLVLHLWLQLENVLSS